MVEIMQKTIISLGELSLNRGTRCEKQYTGNFFAVPGLRMFIDYVKKTMAEAESALETSVYAAFEPDVVERVHTAVATAQIR
jgi:hypothetical protein